MLWIGRGGWRKPDPTLLTANYEGSKGLSGGGFRLVVAGEGLDRKAGGDFYTVYCFLCNIVVEFMILTDSFSLAFESIQKDLRKIGVGSDLECG